MINYMIIMVECIGGFSYCLTRMIEKHMIFFVITIGPIRIIQLIPREVKFITPIHSLRIVWCNRWHAPS